MPASPQSSAEQKNAGTRKRYRLLRVLQWVLSLALLGALVAIVGPREIAHTFATIRLDWALLTVLASLCLVAIAGFNVWWLLRVFADVSLRVYLRAFIVGWAIGLLVPGQVGDASQVLVLKRYSVAYLHSAAAYAVDKVISLGVLLAVAFVGVGLYAPGVDRWLLVGAALGLVALGVGALLLLACFPEDLRGIGRLSAFIRRFFRQVLEFRRHSVVVSMNIALTVVKWSVLAICYVCAFRAVGVPLRYQAAATIPIMSTLIGFVPVTVGGIGTVELTATYLFGLEGIPQATVVAAYILLRVIQYGLAAVLTTATSPLRGSREDIDRK